MQEYLILQSKQKISERTQARWISSIKSFFKYLLEEEIRDDNPATLLEGPKLGLYLPDTLSVEDVERITKSKKKRSKSKKCASNKVHLTIN